MCRRCGEALTSMPACPECKNTKKLVCLHCELTEFEFLSAACLHHAVVLQWDLPAYPRDRNREKEGILGTGGIRL